MTFDWNGNGREDFGDHYIDYEIYNDIYNESSTNNNASGGGRPVRRKKQYTEEELESNWVLIRIVFLILGATVGTLGTMLNILSLFGGYVNWLGLIVSPIILVAVIRYINKNGWPK